MNKTFWALPLMLALLLGCRQTGEQAASATPSPQTSPAALQTQAPSNTGDTGSGEIVASIKPAAASSVQGNSPLYQIDASYFADAKTGWLAAKMTDKQLRLVHTTDGGITWNETIMPGEMAGSLFFSDDKRGIALVSVDSKLPMESSAAKRGLFTRLTGAASGRPVGSRRGKVRLFTLRKLRFPAAHSGMR